MHFKHLKNQIQKKTSFKNILCKINLVTVFECVKFTASGFYGEIIALRYQDTVHAPITGEEIPNKKKKKKKKKKTRMTNRSVCHYGNFSVLNR